MLFSSKIQFVTIPIVVMLLFSACKNNTVEQNQQSQQYNTALEKQMLRVNSELVDFEDETINRFLDRYGWKMEETGSGLRWMLVEEGNGKKAQDGQVATFEYKVYLLNGELVYSSDVDGLKSFRIGHGGVESGLEEGILFLKVGDKARFILPSHLAFGLPGDQNKIPEKASLLYEVKLIDLK